MSKDYKYRLDVLYDELGIATDEPFCVNDNRDFPDFVMTHYDIKVDTNTQFRADENGDLERLTEDGTWVPNEFCFCRLLSFCEYSTKLIPVWDKFYFTFGTDEKYPYQGGWIEISAPSKEEAIRTFKKHYPNRKGSPFYNAADCYDSFTIENKTDMFKNGNMGKYCWETIYYEEE